MSSSGKLWTTSYKKTQNPVANSEEPWAKAECFSCSLHTASPRWWVVYLSHSSGPTPRSTSHPPLIWGTSSLTSGSELGNAVTYVHAPLLQQGPIKVLPKFLVWPVINFYWLRRPRTLVSNNESCLRILFKTEPKVGK